FGLGFEGPWLMDDAGRESLYRYNGKELNEDFGLNLYEYGARWYDPAIGRFTGVDPISDEFPWVSTFNYAENEPIASIDLHGLQRLDYRVSERLNAIGNNLKNKVENFISGTKNVTNKIGTYIYNNIVGNDVIDNTIVGMEQVTGNNSDPNVIKVHDFATTAGGIGSAAEGLMVIYERTKAKTEDDIEAANQDIAKFTLETIIGFTPVAGAAIPANILINTSKDGDVVTSPENIERAAGAFESSRNQIQQQVQLRIDKRNSEKENDKKDE
ncbi:MAG: RHS repeat-associated core domain-containing protein, partial [Bacteroidota bacterium]